jgi:hypothetical protein
MRAKEFLIEGVEFGVARLNDQGAWSSNEFGKYEMAPCWVCDGTGKDSYDGTDCRYCLGVGKSKEWVSNSPTLQVSNANAGAIASMLGLDNSDYSGIIPNEQLPAIMKKLIMLKNQDTKHHTQDPTVNRGNMRQTTDTETGLTSIGRGPTIHDMGRSQGQVDRYVDTLMDMVKFAQQHDAGISWG